MFDKIKEVFANILKSRILVLTIIMCILSFLLLWRVFNLQIINGQEYLDNYTLKIEKTRDLASTRGNIYDKNGKLLAYNELAYAITLEDNGVYNSRAERNKALNKELYRLLKVLDKNKDQIRNDFYISYSERDGYQYTVSGTTLKRFLADIYDHKSTDDLKYNKTLGYNEAEATPEQVMEYLSSDKRYGISDKYSAYNWNQNEFDALVSFAYNIGSIDGLTASGSRSKDEIADKFLAYNRAGGKVLSGLTRRRQEERALSIIRALKNNINPLKNFRFILPYWSQ